jgi:hypothetical protein
LQNIVSSSKTKDNFSIVIATGGHLQLGKVLFFWKLSYLAVSGFSLEDGLVSTCFLTMEPRDLMDFRRILRTHEEITQGNRTSIFSLVSKLTEIMSTLLQVKKQLSILETV